MLDKCASSGKYIFLSEKQHNLLGSVYVLHVFKFSQFVFVPKLVILFHVALVEMLVANVDAAFKMVNAP